MNTLAVKLYPETEQLFLKLFDESDCKTRDQFINLLLENIQNPHKVEVARQEDIEKIENLTQQNNALIEQNSQLINEKSELTEKLNEVTNMLNQAGVIPEGMIMFPVTEWEQKYIKDIQEQLKRTHGYDATSAEIFEYMIKKRLVNR